MFRSEFLSFWFLGRQLPRASRFRYCEGKCEGKEKTGTVFCLFIYMKAKVENSEAFYAAGYSKIKQKGMKKIIKENKKESKTKISR